MSQAILRHPDNSTELVDEITADNFHLISYRPNNPNAAIVVEDGTYVEVEGNSRKVLFTVRTASE